MATTPNVKLISECFIRPKRSVEEAKHPVYLAQQDLAMLSAHYIQKGLLFTRKPNNTFLDSLKNSLSIALVHFYPLAGRLETKVDEDEHSSLVFIDCNKGPGARFIQADLNMTVSEILTPQDVPFIVQSFFDHDRAVNHDGHSRALLSIQVTALVDGVFIGCSMNHACADGTSYWHFFNMWSEIFMADQKTAEIIQISRPPIHKKWFIEGTGPTIKLPFTNPDEFITRYEAPNLRERIFHFSDKSIAKLKAKANEESGSCNKISSFQSLAALLWRCIIRARCFPDETQTRCRLAANNRGRLNPPLSHNYFGNSMQPISGTSKSGELLKKSLGWAAMALHKAVADHGDERVRSTVEGWMECPYVYQLGSCFDPESVMIGSSPRFDMYGNEFGMGKAAAVLSGYANKLDGKVTSYPGREGGGSVDLEICLPMKTMCALESDGEFLGALLN